MTKEHKLVYEELLTSKEHNVKNVSTIKHVNIAPFVQLLYFFDFFIHL